MPLKGQVRGQVNLERLMDISAAARLVSVEAILLHHANEFEETLVSLQSRAIAVKQLGKDCPTDSYKTDIYSQAKRK
jgi:hypothetical protein